MAEQSNPTTSRRRHHRRHRRNSRKRKLRNGVLIVTIAVGMLTVLGLKLIGRGKVHQAEIVQRSYPVRVSAWWTAIRSSVWTTEAIR